MGIKILVYDYAKHEKKVTLLVEKDFENHQASQDNGMPLQPTTGAHTQSAVINEIITTILQQGGKIMLLEENALKDYGGMALVIR